MLPKDKIEGVLGPYNEGMVLYKERKFAEAKACFEKALAAYADDGPSKLYVERCEQYIATPPPADWDGVFVMTTK